MESLYDMNKLSDGSIVSRDEGVSLAKQGGIRGVGIAHRKETEYLKSIPIVLSESKYSI